MALPTLKPLGIYFIYFLLLIIGLLFIRSEKRSLTNRIFGEKSGDTILDRVARNIALYGSGLLGIAVIIKGVLSFSGVAISQNLTLLALLLTWIVLDIGFLAMLAFMEFPFFLEGYYKWKYPEEYREWEGKSVEEWYGKKYLAKRGWKEY